MNTDELLTKARELALDAYTDFLNHYHELNEEDHRVTRADYDEYNDPPRVLNHNLAENLWRLTATVYANPYHDEGGPTLLHCFFNWTIDLGYEDELKLELMIQDFDTYLNVIWVDGTPHYTD